MYLRILPVSYGMIGVGLLVSAGMNAINEPIRSTILNAVRLLVLTLPLAAGGSYVFGLRGLFAGIALANILAGTVALIWLRRLHTRFDSDSRGLISTVA